MRRLAISLLTGLLALLLLVPAAASAADRTHTVQYGETLTSIAAESGVSVDSLASANGLGAPNLIYVGQVLTIPGSGGGGRPAPAAARTGGGGDYVVQPGDTLSGIAQSTGVDVATLAGANGLSDSNFIWAGQRLTLPGSSAAAPPAPLRPAAPPPAAPAAPPATSGSGYTVQAGDNLSTIAQQYGVAQDVLAQANNIANPNLLFAGQVLTIPGAAPAKPATAVPAPARPAAPAATPTMAPAPPGAKATPTLKVAPTPPPSKAKIVPEPGTAQKYTVQAGDRLYSIAAQFNTTVDAIVARNHLTNANNIFSGEVLEVLAGDTVSKPAAQPAISPTAMPMDQTVRKPGTDQAPPAIDPGHSGKWVDVNLTTETLTAYEGNTPVFTSLVSTGVSWHPTVVGTFPIYAKYLADDMSGGSGAEYYYLPAVPYTMYFYGGYALHGTYWHHNFGHPMSHGCVNLPTPAAKWMYNWAAVGTLVTTHW